MKEKIKKIAFALIMVFFASTITSCILLQASAEIVVGLAEGGVAIAEAAKEHSRALKDELPLINLKRISKGVYTVEVPAWDVKYKEAVRNNAINLLVQFMGYESYDFKITGEPNKKMDYSNVWKYSITMPGSIPVVRNEKFAYKIDDTTCTIVKDLGSKRIAYGTDKFVAIIGTHIRPGPLAYSSDGITWTRVNINKTNLLENIFLGDTFFEDIAYGNGKFVAVGSSDGRLNTGGKIAYSSDGINWTDVKTKTFKKESIRNIVYGNGMFVAAADGIMAYSSDGIYWTAIKKFPFKRKNGNFTYCGGKFFVLEDSKIAYSPDGIYWSKMENPFKKYAINNLVYGNGKFVAVGNDYKAGNSNIAYSSDGMNWKEATNDIYVPIFLENKNIDNVLAYGDGKFVIAGKGGKMAYSLDGITWITIADSALNSSDINDIVYGNGKFFVAGNDGKIVYWDGNIE